MNPRGLKETALFVLISLFLATGASGALFEGSSSGVFVDPSAQESAFVTGTGTNHFTWGIPATSSDTSSSLHMAGAASFGADADTVFSFGTLTYLNGTIASGTGATGVDLLLTLHLSSPLAGAGNFTFPMRLINTTNTEDPWASADYVNFQAAADPAGVRYDGVDYTLEFLGFGNVTSNGYSLVNGFHVYEDLSASADLLGRFTERTEPVPEPGTLILLGSGLAGLVGFGRKGK